MRLIENIRGGVADAAIFLLGGPSQRRINSLPDTTDTEGYRQHVALVVPEEVGSASNIVRFDVAAAPGTPVMQEVKAQ